MLSPPKQRHCHRCGLSVTHELDRTTGRFRLPPSTWKPLSTRTRKGEWIVYKGYCIQPTCYTLEEAKQLLGETNHDGRITEDETNIHGNDEDHDRCQVRMNQEQQQQQQQQQQSACSSSRRSRFRLLNAFVSDRTTPLWNLEESGSGGGGDLDEQNVAMDSIPSRHTADNSLIPPPPPAPFTLDGSGRRWTTYEIQLLVQHQLTGIKTLMLNRCDFGDEGVQALVTALLRHPPSCLKVLCLRYNNIGVAGAQALARLLASNHTLQRLSLSYNNIGDAGAEVLFQTVECLDRTTSNLTELALSSNNITARGAKKIGDAMVENITVRSLKLDKNQLGDEGIELICEGLRSRHTLQITQLSLKQCSMGDRGAHAIAGWLNLRPESGNNTDSDLLIGLDGNIIGDDGFGAILSGVEDYQSYDKEKQQFCIISGIKTNQVVDQELSEKFQLKMSISQSQKKKRQQQMNRQLQQRMHAQQQVVGRIKSTETAGQDQPYSPEINAWTGSSSNGRPQDISDENMQYSRQEQQGFTLSTTVDGSQLGDTKPPSVGPGSAGRRGRYQPSSTLGETISSSSAPTNSIPSNLPILEHFGPDVGQELLDIFPNPTELQQFLTQDEDRAANSKSLCNFSESIRRELESFFPDPKDLKAYLTQNHIQQ